MSTPAKQEKVNAPSEIDQIVAKIEKIARERDELLAALKENKDSAYRIITRLQRDNVELFHTLQSATAWVRAAGGDCITLDEIINRHKPAYRDNVNALAAIASATGEKVTT